MPTSATSWAHEFGRSFKNLSELYQFLDWPLPIECENVARKYSLFIPRRLAEKIKVQGPEGVLAREFLPHEQELDEKFYQLGLEDPIGDRPMMKAPQLIHRYSSRALFTPTSTCPVHCRYCFRKNELDSGDELFQAKFSQTVSYLKNHPEISEIIFTGGDPLTLSNEKIKNYLLAFSEIQTIKDIRFHTRYPIILPERIDEGLINVLSWAIEHFRTVSIAIHANHITEFDDEAEASISNLQQTGVQLLSQSVLLKGINDSTETLIELINQFLKLKVRPYYLHHPDQVKGGMHFYLPLNTGRTLYNSLRKYLPGWAIPNYVIDIPGGYGKVNAGNPENTTYSGQLLGQNGEKITVQEPDLST